MKEEARELARVRLDDLLGLLRAQAGVPGHADLIDECEQLRRAIDAFHMEGIRFRVHRLNRALKLADTSAPEGALATLADVRAALEAAGLHIRSA